MMKIALATHLLRGYPENSSGASTPETRRNLFRWLQRHGFDGVEVGSWWFDVYNAPVDAVVRLRNEAAEHGLALAGINCLRKNVTHPAVAEQNRRDLQQAVAAAAAAEIPFVNVSLSIAATLLGHSIEFVRGLPVSPGSSRSVAGEEIVRSAAFLADLARAAAPAGIEIAVELHNCSLADTSRSLRRLLELAAQPNLSANPDLGNLYWAYAEPEEPWHEAIVNLASPVKLWHVKNVQRIYFPETGRAQFVHASLEQGDIDYRWALARLLAAGFDGWISLEGAGPGDWLAFAARGKTYLDELRADVAAGIGLQVH
jgi:sugar phosphate isomerase/epimerase